MRATSPSIAGQDAVEELDDRDLRAQAAPDGAELQADDAGADDEHARSEPSASESAPVDDTICFSSMSMPGSLATSEPVAMTIACASRSAFSPLMKVTPTLPGPSDAAGAVDVIDLVLLQEEGRRRRRCL